MTDWKPIDTWEPVPKGTDILFWFPVDQHSDLYVDETGSGDLLNTTGWWLHMDDGYPPGVSHFAVITPPKPTVETDSQ